MNIFDMAVRFDEYKGDERPVIFPGFCDVHVHFREPGFSYKETIATGSRAAARGGYTAVCTMPNLNPVPDNPEHLKAQTDIIRETACINVYPYGALTKGERGETPADLEEMAKDVIGFSDDGRGVQGAEIMEEVMTRAAKLNKIVAAHCEDNSLLRGGYIHDGIYAARHGHRGICSESEYRQIERDLSIAKKTGCKYHVCHISTSESVRLIKKAKGEGVDVTCETAPHYLLLDENDLQEDGRFKMNPPLRSSRDREALIEGIIDGTIDMIATDHAPHSQGEKSGGLENSAFGIVGLETAFPLLYTYLVREGIISLKRLTELLSDNPRRRFEIPLAQGTYSGGSGEGTNCISKAMASGDWSLWDLSAEETIEPEKFLSMGRATPFAGRKVYGRCLLTLCGGREVYR